MSFAGLTFLAPLALLGLLSLPIVWWILRISPPINTEDKDAKTVTRLAEQWIFEHYPGEPAKTPKA